MYVNLPQTFLSACYIQPVVFRDTITLLQGDFGFAVDSRTPQRSNGVFQGG